MRNIIASCDNGLGFKTTVTVSVPPDFPMKDDKLQEQVEALAAIVFGAFGLRLRVQDAFLEATMRGIMDLYKLDPLPTGGQG